MEDDQELLEEESMFEEPVVAVSGLTVKESLSERFPKLSVDSIIFLRVSWCNQDFGRSLRKLLKAS
jgi:hypothetical protein